MIGNEFFINVWNVKCMDKVKSPLIFFIIIIYIYIFFNFASIIFFGMNERGKARRKVLSIKCHCVVVVYI